MADAMKSACQRQLARREFLQAALTSAGLAALPLPAREASARRLRPPSRAPRFGVNYTPSKNWWYCWLDWDEKSIARDLKAIAALGFDHLRIQCLWPVFQPHINYVSETALGRLRALLDLAGDARLDVAVTV